MGLAILVFYYSFQLKIQQTVKKSFVDTGWHKNCSGVKVHALLFPLGVGEFVHSREAAWPSG